MIEVTYTELEKILHYAEGLDEAELIFITKAINDLLQGKQVEDDSNSLRRTL